MSPLAFLDPELTAKQRRALSASTAVATTAFLQHQPTLFKLAVRLVKYWTKHMHSEDWNNQIRNRPKSYLLVLLTLKAYQQHLATATAGGGSFGGSFGGSSSSEHDQAAALDSIMLNFLRLAAQLNTSTLMCWEVQYNGQLVQQVLARPDLVHVLRPKGCEKHPLALGPANPTNNVAAVVPGITRLVQLAAADFAAVEGDRMKTIEHQLQQLKVQQEATQKQQQEQAVAMQQQVVALQQQLQQQGRKLATLPAYHTIMGNASTTLNFNFSMPVSAWLPDSKIASVAGPIHWEASGGAPGLWLEAFTLPYKTTDYGSKDMLAGIEIRLTGKTEDMQSINEQGLPVALKILGRNSSSMISVNKGGDGGYYSNNYSVRLESDVVGVLRGSAGVRVVLSRSKLNSLGLASLYYPEEDLGLLRRSSTNKHNVKFELQFIVGA